jgi:hypothetical protein
MKRLPLFMIVLLLFAGFSVMSDAYEIKRSALFVFLHEVRPIEDEAAKALEERNYAVALRKYRDALSGYEGIWKEYPQLPQERPYGIDRLVDESITNCKKIIEAIKDQGEAQDEFYQKLNQLIRVDFEKDDVRRVAKLLTSLTDVNIIVDETIFGSSAAALKPEISVRTDDAVPLRKIIISICDQTGLSYSIEKDHIFISTRVKLDSQK